MKKTSSWTKSAFTTRGRAGEGGAAGKSGTPRNCYLAVLPVAVKTNPITARARCSLQDPVLPVPVVPVLVPVLVVLPCVLVV
jgi:hypothetical protein